MKYLKESLVYRMIYRLFVFYQDSGLKKLLAFLSEACRNSLPGKWVKNTMARESAFHNSRVFSFLRKILKVLDRWFMKLSKTIEGWSETSLIVKGFRIAAKASKEKLFALAFPVFGIGYLAGRILQGKLMIRDVFLLGLLFIFAGVALIDREKRKAIWKNSLAYRLSTIILE
ncbi:MAG: hypothetical protein KBA53_09715 [Thermoclostridium sp.]|nr:hypothetical protein [Thermoclostridium sp.]